MGNCLGSSALVDSFVSHPNSASDASKITTSTTRTSSSIVLGSNVKSGSQGLTTARSDGEILASPSLKAFSYNDLRTATRNFRPDSLIGEGEFGCVFKGWIDEHTLSPSEPGSGMVVAIKKLRPGGFQGHKEWLMEVNYLSQLHHPNLVKLIGYCVEEHQFLVCEFMPRGSLENQLFKRGAQPISWATRIEVAIGAAKGLSFLHDAESQVIFGDFKASDILLDADFNAKLSDFGLAKLDCTEHLSTEVMCGQGFAAPEYEASAESDVYSYGVVLLELLTGRRAVDRSVFADERNLVVWARPYLKNQRKLFQIMDAKLEGEYSRKAAFTVASLALKCLNREPRFRPKMSEVIEQLEKLQDQYRTVKNPYVH